MPSIYDERAVALNIETGKPHQAAEGHRISKTKAGEGKIIYPCYGMNKKTKTACGCLLKVQSGPNSGTRIRHQHLLFRATEAGDMRKVATSKSVLGREDLSLYHMPGEGLDCTERAAEEHTNLLTMPSPLPTLGTRAIKAAMKEMELPREIRVDLPDGSYFTVDAMVPVDGVLVDFEAVQAGKPREDRVRNSRPGTVWLDQNSRGYMNFGDEARAEALQLYQRALIEGRLRREPWLEEILRGLDADDPDPFNYYGGRVATPVSLPFARSLEPLVRNTQHMLSAPVGMLAAVQYDGYGSLVSPRDQSYRLLRELASRARRIAVREGAVGLVQSLECFTGVLTPTSVKAVIKLVKARVYE
jgi:hypothetical protein